MNVTRIPLSELKRPERNVRIHTEKQLREFERSIMMFGQIRPIVVDETNTILAGVGCFETLLRMGRDEADVFRIENLTENQKKKLMIADNKLFGLGIDDIETFNDFLEDLQSDLDIPGYDEEILKSMVAEAEDVSEKISTYGTIDSEEIDSIKAAAGKKETMISHAADTPLATEPPESPNTPESEEPPTQANVRKYVICPKCGEKVWL